jgi:hypothetical protein
MAQRTVYIPNIGEVLLAKRRGARNIRLTITPGGKVRVGLPVWVPYSTGVVFAKSKLEWIQKHQAKNQPFIIEHGDLIGKRHRVSYTYSPIARQTTVKVKNPHILITSGLALSDPAVQSKTIKACERALRKEADELLPVRLNVLANRHGFTYEEVKIRKLSSRWGSCSDKRNIRLSFYLIQLPWRLIDYVLIHELIHTRYLHHQKDFWSTFLKALPEAKQLQNEIREYSPRILPGKGLA